MSEPIQNAKNSNGVEISLADVIKFLQRFWKKLFFSALIGAVLGYLSSFYSANYYAENILVNNNGVDFSTFKSLQKSMPNLAAQIASSDKLTEENKVLYQRMSQEGWWQKNVIPSYAISKLDAKELAAISKDLDGASTTILNIKITERAKSKDEAISNVIKATNFFRSGGAYLQIKGLINGYEAQTLGLTSELQQKITSAQIEMGYQIARSKNLEELHKRFPSNAAVTGQVVDPKDSGAKYLPLTTQIIAINNDINISKEMIERYRKRLDQLMLAKLFLEQCIPIVENNFDGLVLVDQLLAAVKSSRTNAAINDINSQEFYDKLYFQLSGIQTRFTAGLQANTDPISGSRGIFGNLFGGLLVGFFLMLIILVAQKKWLRLSIGDQYRAPI